MCSGLNWVAHGRYDDAAAVNLICFPYVGGSASYFAPLKRYISAAINVCPVLFPGRESNIGKPTFSDVKEMAFSFVKENGYLFQSKFALMGHCTGAIVAYEVAVACKQIYDVYPAAFIASSSPAPSCRQFWPSEDVSDEDMIFHLTRTEIISEEFAKTESFRTYYFPLLKDDMRMFIRYIPEIPVKKINAPVYVFHGDADVLFDESISVSAWSLFFESEIHERVFTGGHFYLSEHLEEFGSIVNSILDI